MVHGPRQLVVSVFAASLLLAGCTGDATKARPPLAPYSGIVKYKGKPVEGASVTFIMDGMPRTSMGMTDAEGRFKLTTYDTNDGAFVGSNKVTVVKSTTAVPGKAAADLKPEDMAKMSMSGALQPGMQSDVIPAKYADVKTTTLKYEVVAGGTTDKAIDLE